MNKNVIKSVRLTKDELKNMMVDAEKEGRNFSNFIRWVYRQYKSNH